MGVSSDPIAFSYPSYLTPSLGPGLQLGSAF